MGNGDSIAGENNGQVGLEGQGGWVEGWEEQRGDVSCHFLEYLATQLNRYPWKIYTDSKKLLKTI